MTKKNWLAERQDRRRLVKGAMAVSMVGTGVAATDGSHGFTARAQEPGAHVQAVVSAHQMATEAGLAMLAQGGSAADASIAAAAVLTVVEGWFSSVLGGGTWALYYDATNGEVTSLDGVGPTGSKATREDYGARAASPGIHQSNVPGAWDGWMLWLERYGRLDLGQVLEPAIGLARNGFPASAELVLWLSDLQSQIFSFPDSQRTYAPEDVLPAEGDTIFMPDLANTFESLVLAYKGGLAASRSAAV